MNREELVAFLKESLQVSLSTERDYGYGGMSDHLVVKILRWRGDRLGQHRNSSKLKQKNTSVSMKLSKIAFEACLEEMIQQRTSSDNGGVRTCRPAITVRRTRNDHSTPNPE